MNNNLKYVCVIFLKYLSNLYNIIIDEYLLTTDASLDRYVDIKIKINHPESMLYTICVHIGTYIIIIITTYNTHTVNSFDIMSIIL